MNNYGESSVMTWRRKIRRRTALKWSGCDSNLFRKHDSGYLTIILRNRVEYHLILGRRGLWPRPLKSDDIPQD